MTLFDTSSLFQLSFFVALFIATVHAIIIGYHWLTYGANKKQSWFYLTFYLGGLGLLFIILTISLTKI